MTFLPSLAGDGGLLSVFQAYPEPAKPLIAFHEVLLRGPSPFTPGERELIAAYVSGVNACGYCHGAHTAAAAAFGIAPELLEAALADLDSSEVDERLKPVLRYVDKLTRSPARMTEADAQLVYAAGWDERALHDAVLVCALFNLMNRMVDGLGVATDPEYLAMSGRRLHDVGYAGLVPLIERVPLIEP
jgi:uncharacterized peroxidase-related enzyme